MAKFGGFELDNTLMNASNEEIRRKVVLDVDTKDAEKEFRAIESHLDNLHKKMEEATDITVKTKFADDLVKAMEVAERIINEKIRKINEGIAETQGHITHSSARAKAGESGEKAKLASYQKQMQARQNMLAEYEKQKSSLDGKKSGLSQPSATTINTGEKNQPTKDVSIEQKKAQLESLADTANKTKEAIREAVEETVAPKGGDRFKWGQSKKYFVDKSKEGGGSFEKVPDRTKYKDGQIVSKEEALRSGLPIMTPEKLEAMAKKATEGSGKAESPFGETTYSLNELETKIEEIQSKIQAFRQSIKDNPDANIFQSSLDSLKSMESELKDLQNLRNTYMGKPTKEPTEKPKVTPTTNPQTANVEQEQQGLHGLLGTLREVMSVRAQLASARTALPFSSDAEASQASIKALEGRLRSLQTILGSMKGAPAIQALSSAFSAARTAVTNFANIARQGLDAIISGAQRVGSALASVASTGFHALVSSAQGAVGAFNALNSGARTAISTIASLAGRGFGALKTGLGAAVSGVQNLIGKFQTLSGNVSKRLTRSISSIRSMLMRRLKRTFITSIFNQAKQGLQEFAKYSEAFNESMSSIKNSAKQTAGNMSVTLGNLVNLIAPALNALLGIINSVLTALNSLFALLGGKSTVTTAKKSTDNYAKSLKGAGGAAKDLNHQLYGFDELTRQEDQSGGGGGGGSAIGYEESPIAENLKSFFDKIKEAWEAEKFEEVGRLIGEQLNNIIYKIDDFFIQLRPKAVEWAVKIARVLNGLTAEWDAYATGKMIADGLNLAFDTVYNFINTYDFGVLGRKLAEGLNGLFENTEWDLVGKTFAKFFNSLWETVANFAKNARWRYYGDQLALGINSFFGELDLDMWHDAIVDSVNGIFETLKNLISRTKWDEISKKLTTALKRVVTDIKWEDIAKTFSMLFNNVLNVADNLIKSGAISELGGKIGDMIGYSLRNINWRRLGRIVANGWAEITKAFTNFVKNLNLPELGNKIAEGIQSMFDNIDWNARKDALVTSVNEVFSGIGNAIRGVKWKKFAKEAAESTNSILSEIKWGEIGQTLADGVNAAFGVISEWINTFEWANLGKYLGDCLLTFVNGVNWEDVRTSISGFITGLTDAFNELVESDVMSTLGSRLGKLVNGVLSDINFVDLGDKVKGGIKEITEAFANFIKECDLKNIASQLADGVNAFFDPKSGADFTYVAGKMSEGLNEIIASFGTFVKELDLMSIAQRLGGFVKGFLLQSDFDDLIGTIGQGAVDVAAAMGEFVSTVFEPEGGESLGDKFAAGLNQIFVNKTTGKINTEQFAGLGRSIGDAVKNVIENISNFLNGINWSAVTTSLRTVFQNVPWTDILVGLLNAAKGFLTGAFRLVGGLSQAICDAIGTLDWGKIAKAVLDFFFSGLLEAAKAGGALAQRILEMFTGFQHDIEESVDGMTAHVSEGIFGIHFEYEAVTEKGIEARQRWLADLKEQVLQEKANMITEVQAFVESEKATAGFIQFAIDYHAAFNSEDSEKALNDLKEQYGDRYDELYTALDDYGGDDNGHNYFMFLLDYQAALNAEDSDKALAQLKEEYGVIFDEYEETLNAEPEIMKIKTLLDLWAGAEQSTDFTADITEFQQYIQSLINDAGLDVTVPIAPNVEISDVQQGNWDTIIAEFGKYGIEISQSFVESMNGKAAEDINRCLELLGSGVSQEFIQSLDVDGISASLDAWMAGTGMNLQQTAIAIALASGQEISAIEKQMGVDVGEALGGIIPESLAKALGIGEEKVKEANAKLVEAGKISADQATDMETSGDTAASGTTDKIATKLESGASDVSSATDAVTTPVQQKFEALPKDVQPYAEQLVEYVCTALMDGDGTVKAAIESMAQAAVDRAKEILSSEQGTQIAQTFLDGIKVPLSYDNGYNIMASVMHGMLNGFSANASVIRNNMSYWAKDLVALVKRIFDVRSPSHVFEAIGNYVMQGFEIGINDSGEDAIKAVSDVAKAMIEEGSGFTLGENIEATTSGLDNVADKLTDIANIFSAIADTITEMGGFNIPTIAAGQTIPYRTQLGVSGGGGLSSDANMHGLEDALYNAFTRAMSGTEDERQVNITMMVDGRKMADVVSKYQRQQSRAWGV